MSHIKFISVPEAMTPKDFVDELIKVMNWQQDATNDLNLIHVENMRNGRQHLRISFVNTRRIIEIKQKAQRTSQRKVYSMRFNDIQILFLEMNNIDEKFKLRERRGDRGCCIILIKLLHGQNIKSLLTAINQMLNVNFVYASCKSGSSFVKLINKPDMMKVFHYFKNQNCVVKFAQTELYLAKHNPNQQEISPNISIVSERRFQSPQSQLNRNEDNQLNFMANSSNENSFLKELTEKVDKISTALSTALANGTNQRTLSENIVAQSNNLRENSTGVFIMPNLPQFNSGYAGLRNFYSFPQPNFPFWMNSHHSNF
jgi:hypothetical protein